jgi:hypothetical protein
MWKATGISCGALVQKRQNGFHSQLMHSISAGNKQLTGLLFWLYVIELVVIIIVINKSWLA